MPDFIDYSILTILELITPIVFTLMISLFLIKHYKNILRYLKEILKAYFGFFFMYSLYYWIRLFIIP